MYRWFDSRAGLRHLAKRSLIKVDSEVEFKNWVTLAKTFGVLAKVIIITYHKGGEGNMSEFGAERVS